MKFEHTPGPWTILESDPYIVIANNNEKHLYTVLSGKKRDMCLSDANTRLIAAAPEMLEALIEVAECRLFWEDSMDRKNGLEYEVKKLIEKATGKNIEELLK